MSTRKRSRQQQPTAAEALLADQPFPAMENMDSYDLPPPPPSFSLAPDVLAVRPETGASMSFSHMNGLLHDFGIEDPAQKARLCSMFAFIFEQGIGGLFESLSTLLAHMGYAVHQRRVSDQTQYEQRVEIGRLSASLHDVHTENAELKRVRDIETSEVDAKKGELDELIRAQTMSDDICDQQFSGEVIRLADENAALRDDVDARQSEITRWCFFVGVYHWHA